MFLINTNEDAEESNILTYIEKELGRPISSLEIKMVETWKNNKIEDDLIKEAVRLSLNDGVYSLKYIDKILIDSTNVIPDFKKVEKIVEDLEFTDWDWLDDEEEYITN